LQSHYKNSLFLINRSIYVVKFDFLKKFHGYAKLLQRFYYICKKIYCPKKRGVKNDLFPEGKIGGDEAIFVR